MRHAKNTPNTKHLIQRGNACCGAGWKVALRDAAARRQGDSRCVCSDGGAVWRALCCAVVLREQRVEQSEISEHSEHSDGLADARSFSRCSALRKRRGAYGCHLPARGGPPTCTGLLLAWWGVGGAVGGRGRFAARYALLQHCLDFLQLLFLELCFTALFLEEPTPF